ncbi:hypothetical protein SAMN04488009_2845 [Maribacter sedimenticola]|uniref:Zinc-binding metallo-peptidase n=1 Tax=Maribacter sedimenticola TaxID=228956 RepID=A0ABY1SJ82_9FLAO|nr:hypothetical protein [Maribacter sedimenticola]SNR63085.1 hypothetical protein SAMN04488009_2845 [Maribacter sedimenticola]
MKKSILTNLIAILLCFLSTQLQGQESWIDTSIHSGLIELKTEYTFKTLVSNDSIKTTAETLKNLYKAKLYFDKIFQTDLDFAVLFIENRKWNKHAYFPPPGLPQAGKGNVILGLDKSIVSLEVEKMIFQLPEQYLALLKPVYGENINLDLFYRETLSIHELAHLYHFKEGTKPQRKWLQELFATLSMYSFIKDKANPSYQLMNAYPEFVIQSGDRMAEFKTLKDFEEKYVQKLTPQNYEWYQMQLYRNAKLILDSNKTEILIKLRDFLINTDLSKTRAFSNSELTTRLEKEVGKEIADILTNWKYK